MLRHPPLPRPKTLTLLVASCVGTTLLLLSDSTLAGANTVFPTTPVTQNVAGAPTSNLAGVGPSPQVLTGVPGEPCYGQTDQPHPSSHYPGTVNVVARTVCPPLGVYVSVNLTRDRWYGEQNLNSGANSGVNSVSTNAGYNCQGQGTYTYHGYGYHEASNGTYGYTSNSYRFTC